jgi:hypothetical protein
MQRQLDNLNKVLDYLQTILAVLALVCLVAGTYYNSQIYTYLSQASEPETIILTVTVANTTTSSTCTVPPCSYTAILTESIGITATLSGNVTHIEAQRKAQAAWYWKTQFDNVGIVLLVAYLIVFGIRGIRFVVRRYARNMSKLSGEAGAPDEL